MKTLTRINSLFSKFITLILIVAILTLSAPFAPAMVVDSFGNIRQSLGISLSNIFGSFVWQTLFAERSKPETQEDRDARVTQVEILANGRTVNIGQRVALSATPSDGEGVPVSGVSIEWSITDPDGIEQAIVDETFVPQRAGQFMVTARCGNTSNSSKINVVDPKEKNENSKQDELLPPPPFDEWNVNNVNFSKKLRNLRGINPGKPKGKNNYSITAPIFSVPGRGVGADLNLTYNSNVWSTLNSDVSFDMDRDWVAPGWSLGFGKIIQMVGGGIVQVDANGTKRYFAGDVTFNASNVQFDGQSTDGTFIKTHSEVSGINVPPPCYFSPTVFLKYPDGTTVEYSQWSKPNNNVNNGGCFTEGTPITMVPTVITDRNGNKLKVVYEFEDSTDGIPGKWINKITDSLRREYFFNYENLGGRYYLTSITGPGVQNSTRTFVRLSYKDHTLAYNFSGLTPHVRDNNNNIKVLSAIYYPATQSGYWFGGADSYSPYGIINKVQEQKGMGYSVGTGITAGQTTRTRTYSYPTNTSTALTDIPLFTTATESWEGMTTSPNTSQYQVSWESDPRTSTLTNPDGSSIKEYSFNLSSLSDTDPEKIKDGLTYKTEYYDSNGTMRAKDETQWELGYQVSSSPMSAVPRPKKVTQSMFDNGITLLKGFINETFGEYNQVQEVKEFGYGGETDVLRRTVTSYIKKGDSFANFDELSSQPRLINLPDTIEVFDPTTRIAYTKYAYDAYPLQTLSGNLPPTTTFCYNTYCASVVGRGNLSKVTTYENAAALTGEISDSHKYDITGNLVYSESENTGSIASSVKYTSNTQYSYPEEVASGNVSGSTGLQIKSSAVVDFYTGLTLSITDPYLQSAQIIYDTNSWRATRVNSPTGAYSIPSYDDVNRVYSQIQYDSNGNAKEKTVKKINGLGLPYRQESLTDVTIVGGQPQEIWNAVEIEYDQFSRVKRVSNPFRADQSVHGVYWSERFYDPAGRVWKSVSPDGSTKYTYYNEVSRPQGASSSPGETVRVKDPVNREKWFRTDVDGNLAEVIEPDAQGTGAVALNGLLTKYTYDKLSQLVKTEQGAQERNFRYDSVGRITNQKMAEANATLNVNGSFVGTALGQWTDFYTYDKASNITSHTDARGVTTNYSYANPSFPSFAIDPLNRLFSVSYNTNSATDVLATPTMNITYRTSGDLTAVSNLTVQGISSTDLQYDSFGRVNQKKTTLTSRAAYPMTFDYTYDSLGRVSDVLYPTPYGATITTRKAVHSNFDVAGRLNGLKVDGVDYASNFAFNSNDQVTSLKIGPSGTNQITETYNYNAQTGLLENQKVIRGGTSLLDLSYQYQQCSCSTGGSGQITKITNNLDRNKDRSYDYDALARLKKVSGGINQGWSQTYSYDRYGNRTGITALGFEARAAENTAEAKETDMPGDLAGFTKPPTARGLLAGVKDLSDKAKERDVSKDSPVSLYKNSEDQETQSAQDAGNLSPQSLAKAFDFDNDAKADFSIFNKQTNTWTVVNSGNGQTVNQQFGSNGDQAVPADYDGDGKTDIAVWRPSTGVWYIQRSSDGGYTIVSWGLAGDAVVPADYDGDGKADIAVWRPSNAAWYIYRSSDGGVTINAWGGQQFGDVPVPGDYDGDGKADIAVWRPANGAWWIVQSSNGVAIAPQFGTTGDVPVPAKYDSDAKTDMAIWRPSTGTWYVNKSTNGAWDINPFGSESLRDVLVPADYDGDGKADIAIWRPSSGTWIAQRSTDGQWAVYTLGVSGNLPVPSAYVRRTSAPRNQSAPIPTDGISAMSYDSASNRITNSGYTYDYAGNQTRMVREDGIALRFQYDAAGRLIKVKNDSSQTITTYTYGESRERLITQDGDESSTNRTYYVWEGGSVVSEYSDSVSSTLLWMKNYIYLQGTLLATQEKNGSGETLRFDHSDALGTRLITDPGAGTQFEQVTMPFGTALDNESSGSINQRFTSYDRSATTGLDYATNRFYDSKQGRFTQADPIGFASSSLKNPQSLNLFAYCENDPINHKDPNGLDGFPSGGIYVGVSSGGVPGSGGNSQQSGWARFLGGLLSFLFGHHHSVAGMTVGFQYAVNPSAMLSNTVRYGLPNMGQTMTLSPPDPPSAECLNGLLGVVTNSEERQLAADAIPYLWDAAVASGYNGPQFAYLLATTWAETTFGKNMSEVKTEAAANSDYAGVNGNVLDGDGYLYRGRGYIQLTGRSVYFYVGGKMGYPVTGAAVGAFVNKKGGFSFQTNAFTENPGMVEDKTMAATIAARGLANGWFTRNGKKLSDYVNNNNDPDYKGARRLVNRQDKATKIANWAKSFSAAFDKNCR